MVKKTATKKKYNTEIHESWMKSILLRVPQKLVNLKSILKPSTKDRCTD